MDAALGDLSHGHEDFGKGTKGLASAAALKGIMDGWESRLKAVRNECKELGATLQKAGISFSGNDARVKKSFEGMRSKIDHYSQPASRTAKRAD
ncbi:hypothetical protein [Streptomyces mashuensis]|nr:hypothetical protein [Streptomyces mashuensis]